MRIRATNKVRHDVYISTIGATLCPGGDIYVDDKHKLDPALVEAENIGLIEIYDVDGRISGKTVSIKNMTSNIVTVGDFVFQPYEVRAIDASHADNSLIRSAISAEILSIGTYRETAKDKLWAKNNKVMEKNIAFEAESISESSSVPKYWNPHVADLEKIASDVKITKASTIIKVDPPEEPKQVDVLDVENVTKAISANPFAKTSEDSDPNIDIISFDNDDSNDDEDDDANSEELGGEVPTKKLQINVPPKTKKRGRPKKSTPHKHQKDIIPNGERVLEPTGGDKNDFKLKLDDLRSKLEDLV